MSMMAMPRRNMPLPLSAVPSNTAVVVVSVLGGMGVRQRLAELGFVPGTIIKVINSVGRGPIIVEVRGSRIGLGRGLANKILVQLLS